MGIQLIKHVVYSVIYQAVSIYSIYIFGLNLSKNIPEFLDVLSNIP